ncbi:TPA: DUF1699 domain-containing protein [Candidatus Micrarchaeota archaeon]|nr:DUF1699 domain-containing protein [Candidatus Micrarchaeota archaeon]
MNLDRYPPESEEVYVSRRLSANLAAVLLRRFPRLKRILVPRSVYRIISPKVLNALREVGVEVVSTDRPRGRPPKYSEAVINEICTRYTRGESASEIARDLGIPERSVYYILSRRGLTRR